MTSPSARTKLMEAAAHLFYADGIAATGIGAIIDRAGVAKMSLYNNFDSKDDLVLAYLEARHEEWLQLYRARVANASDPRARALAVVDAYRDHAEFSYERGFRGCGLLNAAAELPAGSPGREAVRQHKEEVETILLGHLTDLTGDEKTAARLAEHCSFVLEGGMARAGLDGAPERLGRARAVIAAMLADR